MAESDARALDGHTWWPAASKSGFPWMIRQSAALATARERLNAFDGDIVPCGKPLGRKAEV
jgi:hypothetical protein